MTVNSYDGTAKVYRATVFQSTGNSWQMTGTWDAGTKLLLGRTNSVTASK